MMSDRSFLDWPFDDAHRAWAMEVEEFAAGMKVDHADIDAACKTLVSAMGDAGLLQKTGRADGRLSVRHLCLARETLARHDGLADFAFAMQGLGTGAISLFGTDAQKAAWLPKTTSGAAIAAFALTEPHSGSDVANSSMTARRDGSDFILNGKKPGSQTVGLRMSIRFCPQRTGPGARGLSAFVVTPDRAGFDVTERLDTIAPHPLATLRFTDCRVPADSMIGAPGAGFKIAMSVLDIFRSTVAAAALGFARRALDEALDRVTSRQVQGTYLAELQMVQGHIADMALDIDAAALLIYRAAWAKDHGAPRVTREAAMAKLFSTEQAQIVIDKAVQLFGGEGVRSGNTVERLYREIRALRIYEGASDVQKVIIARQTLHAHQGETRC